MTANLIWSFVLGAIGLWGIFLAGSKSRFGWLLGLFAQVLWLVFALVTKQYGFIFTAVAYGFVYARNYYRWGNEHYTQRKEPPPQADSRIYG